MDMGVVNHFLCWPQLINVRVYLAIQQHICLLLNVATNFYHFAIIWIWAFHDHSPILRCDMAAISPLLLLTLADSLLLFLCLESFLLEKLLLTHEFTLHLLKTSHAILRSSIAYFVSLRAVSVFFLASSYRRLLFIDTRFLYSR